MRKTMSFLICAGGCLALPWLAHAQTPAYNDLEAIPPSIGRKLPCPASDGDECAIRVELQREVMVWGVPLQAGTLAVDWEGDRSGILARDFQHQGVWLKRGTKVWFYVSWGGTLRNDQTFDGVPCRGGEEATFEQGRLIECTLAAPYRSRGIERAAGTKITLPP